LLSECFFFGVAIWRNIFLFNECFFGLQFGVARGVALHLLLSEVLWLLFGGTGRAALSFLLSEGCQSDKVIRKKACHLVLSFKCLVPQ
jgi:hypothetical protein